MIMIVVEQTMTLKEFVEKLEIEKKAMYRRLYTDGTQVIGMCER